MYRAFIAIAAVVVVLSGCGEDSHVGDPNTQPASYYADYFGPWTGKVDGADSEQEVLSVPVDVSLGGDGNGLVLVASCGTSTIEIPAYQQTQKAIYFHGDSVRCVVQTPCGLVDGRVGGIVLHPTGDGRLGIQVSVQARGCFGSKEETVLMSGLLER